MNDLQQLSLNELKVLVFDNLRIIEKNNLIIKTLVENNKIILDQINLKEQESLKKSQ